jgi:hypothetical protein
MATVTVLTGSFITPTQTAVPQLAQQQRHVVRDIADQLLRAADHVR